MAQMTDSLARAVLRGAGVTRHELEQLCRHWLMTSPTAARSCGDGCPGCAGCRVEADKHLESALEQLRNYESERWVTLRESEAAALLALIERSFDGDYRLPCDVKVAPATIIGKGCPLSTLMTSIKQREGVDVPRMVNPASVATYRNPQPAGGAQ